MTGVLSLGRGMHFNLVPRGFFLPVPTERERALSISRSVVTGRREPWERGWMHFRQVNRTVSYMK